MIKSGTGNFRKVTILLLVVVVAFALFGLLARPVADDFCEILAARDYGGIGSAVLFYNGWSGRFVLFTIAGVLFSAFGTSVAPLVPAVTLLGMLLVWVWALRPFLPNAGFLVVVCIFSFLTGIPNIFQSLYFTSGNLVYLPSIALGGLLVGAVLRKWHPLLVGLIAFGAAGFNEPQALFQGLLLLIFVVRTRSLSAAAGIVGTGISVLVDILSPGNAVRSSFLPGAPSLISAAFLAVQYTVTYIVQTLLTNPLSLAVPFAAGIALARPRGYPRRARLCLMIVLIAAAFNFVLIFPVTYGSGGVYDRVFALPHFVWAVAAIALGWVVGAGQSIGKEALYISVAVATCLVIGWFVNYLPDMTKYAYLTDHGRASSYLNVRAGFTENNVGYVLDCRQYLWEAPYTAVSLYPTRWPGFNAQTLKFEPVNAVSDPKEKGS